MASTQALREIEIEEPTVDTSIKVLRRNLNRLRREARKLDQTAVEECLSLAISLTSPRRQAD